jgi:hypothetical protein
MAKPIMAKPLGAIKYLRSLRTKCLGKSSEILTWPWSAKIRSNADRRRIVVMVKVTDEALTHGVRLRAPLILSTGLNPIKTQMIRLTRGFLPVCQIRPIFVALLR